MAKLNANVTPKATTDQPIPGEAIAQARQDAPGAAKGKKGKKARPTVWQRWGKQLQRFDALCKKIGAAAALPAGVAVESEAAAVRKARADLTAMAIAGGFQKQVAALLVLDAAQVPAPKYAPPPKFTAGQAVFITKAALPKYLKSGFFTPGELAELQVAKVSTNGKAFLCSSKAGSVQVTSWRHLQARE